MSGFASTYADVQYGRAFVARCANEPMHEDADGNLSWSRCPGVLHFDETAHSAPCDTCRAQCGRLVAHWGPPTIGLAKSDGTRA